MSILLRLVLTILRFAHTNVSMCFAFVCFVYSDNFKVQSNTSVSIGKRVKHIGFSFFKLETVQKYCASRTILLEIFAINFILKFYVFLFILLTFLLKCGKIKRRM